MNKWIAAKIKIATIIKIFYTNVTITLFKILHKQKKEFLP